VLGDQGRYAEAEGLLREGCAIPADSKDGIDFREETLPNLIVHLAFVLRQQGKLAEVEDLFGNLVKGGNAQRLNGVARQLATSGDAKSRDGTNAVVLATKAVELTYRKNPNPLGTLAAAHAEAGQFEQAVTVQKEAISLLTEQERIDRYKARLELFEANTPYHEE
jgi:tetratricopeptide (TPR) repeat protein